MSSEKDRSRFEAVSRGATEIGERKRSEGGPAGAEEEIICSRELLTLSTPVLVANIQRLTEGSRRIQGLGYGLLRD